MPKRVQGRVRQFSFQSSYRSRARAIAEVLEERLALAAFTVNATSDTGAGAGSSGDLRFCITQANAAATADTISFSLPAGPQTISLLSALPQFTVAGGGLTITGPGAGTLTVTRNAGAGNFRIFDSLAPTLSISGLTVSGGAAPGLRGGGLSAAAGSQVTLDGVRFTGNSAQDGGAITIEANAFLTIRNSTVSGNTASDDGGGIYFFNNGSLVMENSTVSGNTATADDGGGLYFYGTASATPPSGFTPNAIVVRNSTIHNNTSGSGGGGITLNNFTGTLLVQNSTITNNTASGAGSGVGGGIGRQSGTGTITIVSSVVSGNDNFLAFEIGSSGTVNVNFSAIGSLSGFSLSGSSGNNLAVGIDPLLGPLADNGGPTQTRLPAVDSPLLNVGSNPVPLTTDQRGAGFVRVFGSSADIGAVEVQPVVLTNADSGAGSLREAITIANARIGLDVITFGPVFSSPQTISLLSALPTITDALTITGTTARNLIIRRDPTAATTFRIFSAAANLTVSNVSMRDGFGINGGAIAGTNLALQIVLDGVVIAGNTASGAGGAVFISDGNFLTVRNSTISGNSAAGPGGGVYFFQNGSLLLENSTVSGNATSSANGGGGVYFFGTPSSSPPAGFTPNAIVVRNSTITGNSASGPGGGIRAAQFSLATSTLLVQNSTITNNNAGGGSGGGGIEQDGDGKVTLQSSIVSGNAHTTAPDVASGNPVNANFSAIGSNAGFTLSGSSGNNLPFGANLKLGPLGNYGGPTQTIFPGIGSPVLGVGSNSAGQFFDQRGADRIGADGLVDIGAVETQGFIVVNNADDSGTGSLRAAINLANASPAFDAIAFNPVFFNTPRTISLLSALPTLTGQVTIFGPGRNLLTINRAGGVPDFGIFTSTATTLNIVGLTATGGKVDGTQHTGGGALFVGGTAPNVTLDSVVFSGNSITGDGGGGGVHIEPGGFLTVRNSTISGNTATGNRADGAGIYFYTDGSLVLENSTVSGNTQSGGIDGEGGGIYFYGTANNNPPLGFVPGALLVRNSTIANNVTSDDGGGIHVDSFFGALLVQNSTITGNSAAVGRFGGGINLGGGPGTITITNSIVSGNNASGAPDIASAGTVNVGFSAVGSNTGFTRTDLGGNVAFGANLLLGVLANNGGPTQTRRPLAGSPLLNAGSNALTPVALTTDQRGNGFPRILAGTVDIGAVESSTDFNPPRVSLLSFVFDQVGTPMNFVVGFTESVQASLSADDLVLTNLTTSTTIPTSSIAVAYDGPSNQATFSFPGFANGILPDGKYSFTLLASGVNDAAGNLLDGDGNGTGGDNYSLSFPGAPFLFFLNGDANRDRAVGSADFNILAIHFGTGGNRFSQGNFNYDAAGNVDSADFNILASQFGKSLPGEPGGTGARGAAGTAGGVGASNFFGGGRIGDDDDSDLMS